MTIFPELKYISFISKLSKNKKDLLKKLDFIFIISLMIVDETDNTDYFFYKFNVSKKDQKRIKIIDNFYKQKISSKTFNENNLNKVFYYEGKQAVIDILNYSFIRSKKLDQSFKNLIEIYKDKKMPVMPIGADILMKNIRSRRKTIRYKTKNYRGHWVKIILYNGSTRVDL